MKSAEFANWVLNKSADERPFTAWVHQDDKRDYFEFVAKPDDYYADRADDHLSIYYPHASNKMIGFQLRGVKKLLQECPGIKLWIQRDRVNIKWVLFCSSLSSPDISKFHTLHYPDIVKMVEESGVEAELQLA